MATLQRVPGHRTANVGPRNRTSWSSMQAPGVAEVRPSCATVTRPLSNPPSPKVSKNNLRSSLRPRRRRRHPKRTNDALVSLSLVWPSVPPPRGLSAPLFRWPESPQPFILAPTA
jgi:hypothetical protein